MKKLKKKYFSANKYFTCFPILNTDQFVQLSSAKCPCVCERVNNKMTMTNNRRAFLLICVGIIFNFHHLCITNPFPSNTQPNLRFRPQIQPRGTHQHHTHKHTSNKLCLFETNKHSTSLISPILVRNTNSPSPIKQLNLLEPLPDNPSIRFSSCYRMLPLTIASFCSPETLPLSLIITTNHLHSYPFPY